VIRLHGSLIVHLVCSIEEDFDQWSKKLFEALEREDAATTANTTANAANNVLALSFWVISLRSYYTFLYDLNEIYALSLAVCAEAFCLSLGGEGPLLLGERSRAQGGDLLQAG